MYARNAASPRPITVGQIILIADGTVQTTGVSAKVRKDGGAWTAGSGSTSVEEGVWSYTPTQGETDCEALEVLVYKASCYQAWQEVITTAVSTFGKVRAATVDDKTDYSLSEQSREDIGTDFLAASLSKGTGNTIGRLLWTLDKTNSSVIGAVVADAGNTASSFLSSISVDAFTKQVLVMTSGDLVGQARVIDSVSSGVVTLQRPLTATPAGNDEFLIIPEQVYSVAEIQSGLATAANQTTILNRLGSWTGSGLNTILGAFRALAGKAASLTPTDISSGTTYDNTTDSLEAIRDRGDAAWAPGEAGSGDASQSTLLAVQDQVEAIAGTLGGTSISVTNRIADGGSMVLYTGDDMRVRSGTSVTVTISDAAGGIYSRLSAIGAGNLAWGAARQSQAAGAISGTISSLTQSGSGSAQVVNLVIEINDAGQSLNPADDYIWQVVSTSGSGDEYTEIEGTLDLRRRVAVPV